MMSNIIQWWGETIRTQRRVYFPGGKGKAVPVDPRDIAALASAVLTQPGHAGRIYDVTGPDPLSAREMVDILSRVLGERIRYVRIPLFVAAIAMRRFGATRELTDAIKETFRAWERNEYAYVSDAVERVTGIKPRNFGAWGRDHSSSFTG
jgi:(4-alkanoyl-5-oxo-2,5-dihydrofuran-3-yl)methyl phosphate reductase